MTFDRDSETARLGQALRNIDPVVHSLDAGPFSMVIKEACARRVNAPGSPRHGKLLLCFVSEATQRDHAILIESPVVTDGGLDAVLVEDGWLDGAPPVALRIRPLTIAWGKAHGVNRAFDFDDDNDPVQVEVYRSWLAMHHDPFGGV